MNRPPSDRSARSGGFLLAMSILTGAVAGILLGQPSIGLLIGFGVGLLLLGIVWWVDRRR